MILENIVFDAVAPKRAGQFWEALLGCEPLTDEPAGYETRYAVPDGPVLDLCFQQVPEPATGPSRLHLQVAPGTVPDDQELADPEGNAFSVGPASDSAGLTALRLESGDPVRDAAFWAWLSGWTADDTVVRHPSGRGPVLSLHAESEPKVDGKNRIHLDLRLEAGEDREEVEAAITAHGGRRVHHPEWGELPWRTYQDPSGNEFCVLG